MNPSLLSLSFPRIVGWVETNQLSSIHNIAGADLTLLKHQCHQWHASCHGRLITVYVKAPLCSSTIFVLAILPYTVIKILTYSQLNPFINQQSIHLISWTLCSDAFAFTHLSCHKILVLLERFNMNYSPPSLCKSQLLLISTLGHDSPQSGCSTFTPTDIWMFTHDSQVGSHVLTCLYK